MRYETKTVRIGEWLGEVPSDWDYEGFYKKHLSQNRKALTTNGVIGVLFMGDISPKTWKAMCAAHFVKRAAIAQEYAEYLAGECFNTCNDDGGYLEHDPEDAAEEEMSYWND